MNSQQSLKAQLDQLYWLGNKAGLYDAVDFIKVFIKKQDAINAKQRVNSQIQKDLRRNGSLPKVRDKKTRNVEIEAGHERT